MSSRKKGSISTNPFRCLKGLSVSGKDEPVSKKPLAPQEENASDEELFAREMARLGLESPGDREPPGPEVDAPQVESGDASGREESDVFLQALGTMEVTFRDEISEGGLSGEASPRRMKQLRQGKIVPEARLDLHGLNREQARERVRFFLEDSVYHRRRTVIIITGRGKRSKEEPVLRQDMERYLRFEAKAWVAEWGRAPRQYGGEGALVVFLRGKKG